VVPHTRPSIVAPNLHSTPLPRQTSLSVLWSPLAFPRTLVVLSLRHWPPMTGGYILCLAHLVPLIGTDPAVSTFLPTPLCWASSLYSRPGVRALSGYFCRSSPIASGHCIHIPSPSYTLPPVVRCWVAPFFLRTFVTFGRPPIGHRVGRGPRCAFLGVPSPWAGPFVPGETATQLFTLLDTDWVG